MTKKKKGFWLTLLSEGETDTVSSKRLSMIISLIVLVILAFLSAFGYSAGAEYSYIFGSLVAAESGLTVIEKTRKKISGMSSNKSTESSEDDSVYDTNNEESCA